MRVIEKTRPLPMQSMIDAIKAALQGSSLSMARIITLKMQYHLIPTTFSR